MKKIILVLSLLLLFGCQTTQPGAPTVLTQETYLVVKISDDIIEVPKNIPKIDLSKSTQKDIGEWMIENEKRTVILENKLLATKNIVGAIVKKEKLQEKDYRVVELGKDDLMP